MAQRSNRQVWIDVYKGIAIALVVLGHLRIGQGIAYRFIFLFHMYAFFFIGGVTWRDRPNKGFLTVVWETVKRLYVPYVLYAALWVVTALTIGLYQGQAVAPSVASFGENVLNILLGGGVIAGAEEVGPAWFLCALLVVRVSYCALSHLGKHNRYFLGAVAAGCFALAYGFNGNAVLPLRLVQSLSAFTFFYIGDLCKNLCDAVGKWEKRRGGAVACLAGGAVLFGIVLCLAAVSDQPVMLVGNTLPDSWLVTLIGGIAGCIGLVLLSVAASGMRGVCDVLAFFGGYSMIVMGLHSQFRVAIHLVLELLLGISAAWVEPLTFGLTFVCCLPAIWVISRYIPVLAGQGMDIEKWIRKKTKKQNPVG